MLEMADSITSNPDVLAESDYRVFRNGKVIRLLKNNKDLPTNLVQLNCTNDFASTEKDIYNVMHFLILCKVPTKVLPLGAGYVSDGCPLVHC